jgi:hypothetical protein
MSLIKIFFTAVTFRLVPDFLLPTSSSVFFIVYRGLFPRHWSSWNVKMTLHLPIVPNCLECMEFYLYSHCTSASCVLRQRCSFSLYILHTGKHYHKRRVKRQSPPPMYIAIEYAVYVM